VRLLPVPQAVADAEKAYRRFDSNRERTDKVDEIHRLTKAGVSATAIAVIVGMSDRQVQRIRSEHAAPKRWYRFDRSEIRSERLERTAAAAIDLACRIRDEDPQLVFRSLDLMERQALMELTMILLAGFPIDLTVDEIFEWVLT
jgi:deferrochelatase/peroxidase EfeB